MFKFLRSTSKFLRFAVLAAIITIALIIVLRRQVVTFVANRTFSTPNTVLLVGTNGKLADTIIVAYFGKEENSSPRLLVISRDTEVNGHKINSYWPEGQAKFKARVEAIMGHKIDNTMAIPFEKMPTLLDEAFPQGLSVPVPYRLKYADSKQGFSYDISKGRQTLDTNGLMALLRDRYSDPLKRGEAARVSNWKRFFIEFRNAYQRPKYLARVPALANAAQKIVKTDMTANQMGGVLTAFITNDFSTNYLPITSRYDQSQRRWITTLDAQAAKTQAKLLMKGVVIPARTRVCVLNGTDNAGLARRFAARIKRNLGASVSTGNAPPGTLLRHSTIAFSQSELSPLADEIGAVVKAGNKASMPTSQGHGESRIPVIVVTLGKDAL